MAKVHCDGFIVLMVCCGNSLLMVCSINGYVAFDCYVVCEGSLWQRFVAMVSLHRWFVVAIVC